MKEDISLDQKAIEIVQRFPKAIDEVIMHKKLVLMTATILKVFLFKSCDEEAFYTAKFSLKKLRESCTESVQDIDKLLVEDFESYAKAKDKFEAKEKD